MGFLKKFTKQEISWMMYDWANSAHSVIVVTILPIFFDSVASCTADSVSSMSIWGYATSIAMAIVALAALVCLCRAHGVPLIDCQQQTTHLARLGAHAISRADFLDTIKQAQQQPVTRWQFDHTLWDALLR